MLAVEQRMLPPDEQCCVLWAVLAPVHAAEIRVSNDKKREFFSDLIGIVKCGFMNEPVGALSDKHRVSTVASVSKME